MAAKRLAGRPKVSKFLLPFFQAYYDLLPEAPEYNGMITWRSVANYAYDLGFTGEYMEFMFDVLRAAQRYIQEWDSTK